MGHDGHHNQLTCILRSYEIWGQQGWAERDQQQLGAILPGQRFAMLVALSCTSENVPRVVSVAIMKEMLEGGRDRSSFAAIRCTLFGIVIYSW